jgi:hypothetical protein
MYIVGGSVRPLSLPCVGVCFSFERPICICWPVYFQSIFETFKNKLVKVKMSTCPCACHEGSSWRVSDQLHAHTTFLGKNLLVPIEEEAVWAPEPIGVLWSRENPNIPAGYLDHDHSS